MSADLLTQEQRDDMIREVFDRFKYESGLKLLMVANSIGVERELAMAFVAEAENELYTWSANV